MPKLKPRIPPPLKPYMQRKTTPERLAIIAAQWPTYTGHQEILAAINALPGPEFHKHELWIVTHSLGIKRPKNFRLVERHRHEKPATVQWLIHEAKRHTKVKYKRSPGRPKKPKPKRIPKTKPITFHADLTMGRPQRSEELRARRIIRALKGLQPKPPPNRGTGKKQRKRKKTKPINQINELKKNVSKILESPTGK